MAKGHSSKKAFLARRQALRRKPRGFDPAAFLKWVHALFLRSGLGNDTIFYHSPAPAAEEFVQCSHSTEEAESFAKPWGLWATFGLLKGTSFLNWEVKEGWFTSGLNYICTLQFKESATFTYKVDYEGETKPVLVVTSKNLDAFASKFVTTYHQGERYPISPVYSTREEADEFMNSLAPYKRYQCDVSVDWRDQTYQVIWYPDHTSSYFNHKWLMERFAGLMFREYPKGIEKLKILDTHMWYSGIDADSVVVWDAHVVEELRTLAKVPSRFGL